MTTVDGSVVETADWSGAFGRQYRTTIYFTPVYAGGSLASIRIDARETNTPLPAFLATESTKSAALRVLGSWLKNRLGGARGDAANVLTRLADGSISVKDALSAILVSVSTSTT